MIARRAILTAGAGAVFLVSSLSGAQDSTKRAEVGLLSPFSAAATAPWHKALRDSLARLGWIEGKNVHYEVRYAGGDNERIPQMAAELVRLRVDVIVTAVATDTVAAK